MNKEEITEATRTGTIQAISGIIFIWSSGVLLLLGLLFLVGSLNDNHKEYNLCIEIKENHFYGESEDYICRYFGEKNYWTVWQEALNRFDLDDPTITIYAKDKFEEVVSI